MIYAFAGHELDTGRHVLLRRGAPVPVEPMVFDLLHLLARHPGELVTREAMIEDLWQGRAVSDAAISACIAAARRAVGDDGQRQAVIRTVPRRGLRLVAEVSPAEGAPPADSVPGPQNRIRFTRSDRGQRIAYVVMGDGPPVIRVSSTFTDLEAEWRIAQERIYMERIAERCRLVRFDPVGSGQSERQIDRYDLRECADDIRAVADAAGLDRFAIYAESGGCAAIGLTFAAAYPERLSRLAIVGGFVNGRAIRPAAPSEDVIRGLIAAGWATPESGFITAFLASYFPEGPLEYLRDYARMAQAAISPENVLKDRDMLNAVSIEALLPQVRCPTLILHARHDAVHPLSEGQKLAAGIAGAELVVLETANHIPLHGNPAWEGYMTALTGFLAG